MNDNQQIFDKPLAHIGRFRPGVSRWIAEGEINMEDDAELERVNLFLRYVGSTEAGEFYDSDFNGLSYSELVEFFKLDLAAKEYSTPEGARYVSVYVPSFEALQKYRRWTDDWCITLSEVAFEEYAEGGKKYFLLLRDDYRVVPKKPSAHFPNDSYGESILCVIVDSDGNIDSVTNRWNAVGTESKQPEEYLLSLLKQSNKTLQQLFSCK